MSQCLRCGRELIDPNAKYGWRCAQKVGIPYGNGGSLVKKFPELEKLYIFLPDTSKKKFDVYFDEMEEKNSYIDTAIEGAGMYMSIADELEKAYNEQISKKNEQNQRIDNLMKTKIEFEKNKKLEELQALDKMIEQYQNGSLTFENELDNKIQPDPIKIWTRADIVLDENDKKLSIPNQEKLIDEKLKWHNASDVKEQETAAQQGKQIRENDKITPDNFRDYSPEKQLEYITDLTKKSNIKLDERDMNYLSDFLSNDQELNLNEKGDMVKVLQKALRQIGFRDITMDTGNYSEKTRAAIASIVELVTGNKNSGSKIGKEEKAKFVQILSEVADGDTTIAQKLKDGFDANFNKERFDEVTGKNKVEEKKEEDSKPEDSKEPNHMLSDTFYNITNKPKEFSFANYPIKERNEGEQRAKGVLDNEFSKINIIPINGRGVKIDYFSQTIGGEYNQKIYNAIVNKYGVKAVGKVADLILEFYKAGKGNVGKFAVGGAITKEAINKMFMNNADKDPSISGIVDDLFEGELDSNIQKANAEYNEIMTKIDRYVLSKNIPNYSQIKVNYLIKLNNIKKDISNDKELPFLEKDYAKKYIDKIIEMNE